MTSPRLFALVVLLLGWLGLTSELMPLDRSSSWAVLPSSPDANRARHDDVFFINETTGWLVNTRGEIWNTADTGATWTLQISRGTSARFRSIGFATSLSGWAGTISNPDELLHETRDGGMTWTNITDRISGPAPSGLCGISVVSSDIVYGVGAYFGEPYLIKTSDGGATWMSTSLAHVAATLIDVHFFDALNGIAVGGSGESLDGDAVVIITTDGGTSWQRIYKGTRETGIGGEWAWKISFPTRLVGYVSVEYLDNRSDQPAKILKTTDGGLTWTALAVQGSTDPFGLQGVGFATPEVGWASGRGTTSVTIDGGSSWTQVEPHPVGELDGRVNRFRFVNDSLAFAIGARVYRMTGPLETSLGRRRTARTKKVYEIDQNFPNPFDNSTTIAYELYESSGVRVTVHDLRGRHVRTLIDDVRSPGKHELR